MSQNFEYGKCPKLLYIKTSDNMSYVNSAVLVQKQSDQDLHYLSSHQVFYETTI